MSLAGFLVKRFEPQLAAITKRVRQLEEFFGPGDDWVEDDRRVLFEAADWFLRPLGRSTIKEVPPEGHIVTVDLSPDEVEERIHPLYKRNLLSTRKYRDLSSGNGGRQWAVGSWVHDPTDKDWQHHIYLFPSPSGGTEIYGHKEPSVRDPSAHVDPDTGVHGDPDNILRSKL